MVSQRNWVVNGIPAEFGSKWYSNEIRQYDIPTTFGSHVVSPLPWSGFMIRSKCRLIMSGRRYLLPASERIISPLRSEDIRRASKQLIEASIPSKHPSSTLCVTWAEPEAPLHSSSRSLRPYCRTLNTSVVSVWLFWFNVRDRSQTFFTRLAWLFLSVACSSVPCGFF